MVVGSNSVVVIFVTTAITTAISGGVEIPKVPECYLLRQVSFQVLSECRKN